jgi:hypothetical protein
MLCCVTRLYFLQNIKTTHCCGVSADIFTNAISVNADCELGIFITFCGFFLNVAHVIIDGGIDTAFIKGIRPDFEAAKAADGILSPDAIALQYVVLHKQHRSAWTHEMDLRPWSESF